MSGVVDDKSGHCIPFILDCMSTKSSVDAHHSPLFVGVNGAQGSGKTTLVSLSGIEQRIVRLHICLSKPLSAPDRLSLLNSGIE